MRHTYFFLTVISSLLYLCSFAQNKKPFIRFEENGKYGLVDTLGNTIIDGFDFLNDWNGFITSGKNDTLYVLDGDFRISFKGIYNDITAGAVKNQYIVKKDDKYGVVDAKNKVIIPFEYVNITKSSTGYYQVRMDKLEGILSAKGKIVIPIIYNNITGIDIRKMPIMLENEQGKKIINLKNHVVKSPFEYDYLISLGENFMIVNNNRVDYYLLNAKGESIAGPFDYMDYYKDDNKDFILAKKDGKSLIYDSKRLDLMGTYDSFYGIQVEICQP